MLKLWLVWCSSCGRSSTAATPPNHVDFVKEVQCVLCNRVLDAKKGRFVIRPIRVRKPEPIDLLEVSG